jgi:hypothetical protein
VILFSFSTVQSLASIYRVVESASSGLRPGRPNLPKMRVGFCLGGTSSILESYFKFSCSSCLFFCNPPIVLSSYTWNLTDFRNFFESFICSMLKVEVIDWLRFEPPPRSDDCVYICRGGALRLIEEVRLASNWALICSNLCISVDRALSGRRDRSGERERELLEGELILKLNAITNKSIIRAISSVMGIG